MNWRAWNTRATVAVTLAALSVVTLVVPPVAFFIGLIGVSFGTTAWLTSPEHSESRTAGRRAAIVSGAALAALIAAGSVYSALS